MDLANEEFDPSSPLDEPATTLRSAMPANGIGEGFPGLDGPIDSPAVTIGSRSTPEPPTGKQVASNDVVHPEPIASAPLPPGFASTPLASTPPAAASPSSPPSSAAASSSSTTPSASPSIILAPSNPNRARAPRPAPRARWPIALAWVASVGAAGAAGYFAPRLMGRPVPAAQVGAVSAASAAGVARPAEPVVAPAPTEPAAPETNHAQAAAAAQPAPAALGRAESVAIASWARELINRRSFAEARTLLESRVQAEPDDAEWRILLGDVLAALHQNTAALDAYRVAVRHEPHNLAFLQRLASLEVNLDDPAPGIGTLQQIVRLDPEDPGARAQLDAIVRRAVARGIGVPPASEDAQLAARATELIDRHRYAEAREALAPRLSAQPNNAAWHCLLGDLLAAQHQTGTALEAYRAAVRLEPHNVDYLGRLAELEASLEDPTPAIATLREVVRLDPTDTDARATLERLSRRPPPRAGGAQANARTGGAGH